MKLTYRPSPMERPVNETSLIISPNKKGALCPSHSVAVPTPSLKHTLASHVVTERGDLFGKTAYFTIVSRSLSSAV